MSSYKGLFVQTLDNGEIFSVQVEDSTGISLSLPPDEYNQRGILPPIDELPNSKDYSK